jgi:hypothetical protein
MLPRQAQGRAPWHDERMVTLVRFALRLIEDALRWVVVLRRNAVRPTRHLTSALRRLPPFGSAARKFPWERRRRLDGVLVMQSAQHGFRAHKLTRRPWTSGFELRGVRRSCGRSGDARPQCAVRTRAVVVSDPLAQDRAEMRLGQRDHPIQALAPDRADHALADRVGLGARER